MHRFVCVVQDRLHSMKNFEIKLMLPTEEHRRQVEEYKQKFIDFPSEIPGVTIHGCGSLSTQSFDSWLQECNDHAQGKNLPDEYVPATQFLAIRKSDNKLVGTIQIRHALTPHLSRIGGHVGYSVAPDERNKGYAAQMLKLGLGECRKLGIERVRVSCVKENAASANVIKKCGGKYDGDAEHDDKVLERYWIELNS